MINTGKFNSSVFRLMTLYHFPWKFSTYWKTHILWIIDPKISRKIYNDYDLSLNNKEAISKLLWNRAFTYNLSVVTYFMQHLLITQIWSVSKPTEIILISYMKLFKLLSHGSILYFDSSWNIKIYLCFIPR